MDAERLGNFTIVRELGSGGMGTVYEALDLDGRRVALKLVHPHLIAREGFRERLLREATVGRKIVHANVVGTLDAGEIDGRPFIALEFVVGQELGELRREMGRVPETLCCHIGQMVARGLAAIHAQGVVHRDIKPENILITPDHEIRLMDLGLARSAAGLDRMTQTGQFVGSPAYAPPEKFTGEGTLDARSDLYSLGVTLYELATGQRPFAAESLEALAAKILKQAPPRPSALCSEISPFFEHVLLALLAKDPTRRIESAAALVDVLGDGEASEWWSLEAPRIVRSERPSLRRFDVPRETECVGRESELAALSAALDAAKAGDGRVILIEGEAGVGKTRLLDQFVAQLEERGEKIRFLHGTYPPGGAATATGAFANAVSEELGGESSLRYVIESPALVRAFDALLRGDAVPEDARPLTPDALKTVFVHVVRALASARPTVVAIDDLHFGPDEARSLFASLAMGVPGHPILLIGTARPGLPIEWLSELESLHHVSRKQLPRLTAEDVSLLLAPIVGASLHAEELATVIAATGDGNPFFLVEIVRSLRNSGVLSQTEDGAWATLSRIRDLAIPATIQSLLDARIERLEPEERELLECAACWGIEFDGRLIAEAVGMRRLPALRTLARIEQEHGLVRAVGGQFAFDHHAVQEHLTATMPDAIREELHAVLAETLEERSNAAEQDPETLDGALCADLCDHYLRGGRGRKAVRYLAAAQAHLADRYRHTRLVGLGERALAMPGLLTGDVRARELLRLASTLDQLGERARQAEVAREAQDLVDGSEDQELRRAAAAALCRVYWRISRHDDAEAAGRRALELAQASGDRHAESIEMNNLGNVLKSRGERKAAEALFERQLELGTELGEPAFESRATNGLGNIAFAEGRFDDARKFYERSLALSIQLGDPGGEAASCGNLGNVLYSVGQFEPAREYFERQLALTRRVGDRNAEARATGALAMVMKSRGLLAESPAQYLRAIELSRETGDQRGEMVGLVNLGSTLVDLGDFDSARETLERAIMIGREIGAPYPEGYALLTLASVADEEGDSETALTRTNESLTLRRKIGHGDGVALSLIDLGDRLQRTGDADGARAALDEALVLVREQGRLPHIALALAIRACLPGGDAAEARKALVAAGDSGDSVRIRHLLWQADGNVDDLDAAKDLLDEALAKVEEPHRTRMRTRIRVHREVTDAWGAHYEDDDDA